eukprot:g509.t1
MKAYSEKLKQERRQPPSKSTTPPLHSPSVPPSINCLESSLSKLQTLNEKFSALHKELQCERNARIALEDQINLLKSCPSPTEARKATIGFGFGNFAAPEEPPSPVPSPPPTPLSPSGRRITDFTNDVSHSPQVEKLVEITKSLRERVISAEEISSKAKEKVQHLEEISSDLELKSKRLGKKVKSLEARLENSEADNRDKAEEISKLQVELAARERKAEGLIKKNKTLRRRLSSAQTSLKEAAKRLQNAEVYKKNQKVNKEMVEKISKRMDVLMRRNATLREQLKGYRDENQNSRMNANAYGELPRSPLYRSERYSSPTTNSKFRFEKKKVKSSSNKKSKSLRRKVLAAEIPRMPLSPSTSTAKDWNVLHDEINSSFESLGNQSSFEIASGNLQKEIDEQMKVVQTFVE